MTSSNSKKFDDGKLRFDLIEPQFTRGIAAILTLGAQKYSPHSWRTLDNARARYIAAVHRHLNAWQQGEILDKESGESHLYHAACNLMFLDFFDKNEVINDD